MAKRKRRVGSVAEELVKKSREAMLTAVQIFNNPQVEFKAELFIVTSMIAWTYLLHGHFRRKKIEYRKFTQHEQRKQFETTRYGAYWHLSLGECLDHADCPLDDLVKKNLRFLIGVRNEIEHQMTTRIDDTLSAKFQAAALNFNSNIKTLFGEKYSLDSEQAFSIQFCGIDEGTAKNLMECGFRRRRTVIPEGTRTAFRAEGEQFTERSDAGSLILP